MLATPLLMSPFVFLIDVWIRTYSAEVASKRATNLATHLTSKNQCTLNHFNTTGPVLTDTVAAYLIAKVWLHPNTGRTKFLCVYQVCF
jgi:hypothetical protein